MNTRERIEITFQHRNRLAITYVRLAAAPTTDRDEVRLEYQRSQRRHAYDWGWSPDAVQVIDEDTGRSGAGGDGRPGFQRLCRMIAAGQVGLVLVSDLARLGRSWRDALTVLRLCEATDTLLAVDGCLVDPSTLFLRHSRPVRIAKDGATLAYQRRVAEQIREIFPRCGEGETDAETADALNTGGIE